LSSFIYFFNLCSLSLIMRTYNFFFSFFIKRNTYVASHINSIFLVVKCLGLKIESIYIHSSTREKKMVEIISYIWKTRIRVNPMEHVKVDFAWDVEDCCNISCLGNCIVFIEELCDVMESLRLHGDLGSRRCNWTYTPKRECIFEYQRNLECDKVPIDLPIRLMNQIYKIIAYLH
jgi:hypothetical protein